MATRYVSRIWCRRSVALFVGPEPVSRWSARWTNDLDAGEDRRMLRERDDVSVMLNRGGGAGTLAYLGARTSWGPVTRGSMGCPASVVCGRSFS